MICILKKLTTDNLQPAEAFSRFFVCLKSKMEMINRKGSDANV
ncbi:hypothetical protein KP77_13840 [Jeotgalibacillus alimentarius]|uniref:Uncharacterized protein n=1 Tax=Jeotgalibacillus alimentarius TaxID=135826 RepID=A0A0C2S9V4_9BACL|nr:hypothetical protein KP77_13840 [Jeotgalibacillus alimentarius]